MSELPVICPECGGENLARNRFCIECGKPLERACPRCGEPNPPRASFCGQCGGTLDAGAPGAASARPDEYTPRHLAERVLGSRVAMEGERKQVTVLFADVVGSTELIRDLDPEAAVARLRPAVDAMMAAVHRHEGLVNRVQGDGVMALFGAPIAHEDHAARAALAALEMRDAVGALGDDALHIRVGLNAGEVVVRAINSDLTVEYEADGPTVHLASRMEQLARPGTVRTTRATYRLAEGYVDARDLGACPVKGAAEPIEQVELLRAVDAASRWEIRARRGLTRFVGRDAELGVLTHALALASEGHGQLVAVAGEPGMGKSRLLHEFLTAHVPHDWTVRVTAATGDGRDTPYLPLRTLLRSVLGVAPGAPAEGVAAKVERLLAELGLPDAELGPALCALVDAPLGDSAWERLEPTQRRRSMIDAFKTLTLARATRTPLLLVLEDLHWVDTETQSALDALVDGIAGAPILLLVSYRPEYADRWSGRSWHRRVDLSGLDKRGAEVLAGALLGDDPSVASLCTLLAGRTEGRPLFVEETVRALVEEGQLAGERGAYRLTREIDDVRIPVSVQAVLAARIDRLEPETKLVLQTAAVLGRVVPMPLLEAVSGLAPNVLREHVERLLAAEFLFERQVIPVPEYVFKHALTEAVAYEGLLRRRRVALHARALEAMESLHGAGIEEQIEALARHAYLGERWEVAVDYLRRAARKATARSAYPEARHQLEQALLAIERVPQGPDRAAAGVDVRLEMRPALGATGRYPEILERLEESEALASEAADDERLLRVRADKVHVLYHLGHCAEAIRVGEEAVRTARLLDDRRVLVQASENLGHAHFWRGEFRSALAIASPYVADLAGALRHERIGTTATSSCLWIGNVCGMHAMLGEFAEAQRHGRLAGEIARETGRPFDLAISGSWHGFALLEQGEDDDAEAQLRKAYDVAVANELDFIRLWISNYLGAALLRRGDVEQAYALLASAVATSERLELVTMGLWARLHFADAMLARGEAARARAQCELALDAIRRTGFRWAEPAALRVLAASAVACDADAAGAAPALLRESVTLCRLQETAPQLARTELALGAVLAAHGDIDAARAALRAAHDGFHRLDMRSWATKARAALSAFE